MTAARTAPRPRPASAAHRSMNTLRRAGGGPPDGTLPRCPDGTRSCAKTCSREGTRTAWPTKLDNSSARLRQYFCKSLLGGDRVAPQIELDRDLQRRLTDVRVLAAGPVGPGNAQCSVVVRGMGRQDAEGGGLSDPDGGKPVNVHGGNVRL